DGAGARGGNVVHGLHRLDDEQGVALGDLLADRHEGRGPRLGRQIDGADHGRGHRTRQAGRVGLGGRGGGGTTGGGGRGSAGGRGGGIGRRGGLHQHLLALLGQRNGQA